MNSHTRPDPPPPSDNEGAAVLPAAKRARASPPPTATTTTMAAPPPPQGDARAAATRPTPPLERPLACADVREWLPNPSSPTPPITVSQPAQVGCWTRLSRLSGLPMRRRFRHGDTSGLPRLALPTPASLPVSLDEGYPERFVRKPEGERSGVEAVVRGAVHPSTHPSPAAAAAAASGGGDGSKSNSSNGGGGGIDWSMINICTYRNNLNKVLGVPIDLGSRDQDGWCIDATLLEVPAAAAAAAGAAATTAPPHRVLFLDVQPDPEERTFPGQDRFMYYGYKLETICTEQHAEEKKEEEGQGNGGGGTPAATTTATKQQPPPPLVDSTSEYCALMAVRLGRHRVLMAAEIDAAEQPGGALAEIKCYRPPPPQQQQQHGGGGRGRGGPRPHRAAETLFRRKHQKWWVQSFLAGVPLLVLGQRDERGDLVAVHRVPVSKLADVSAKNGFAWQGERLLAFGDAALGWMRRVAEEEQEKQRAAGARAAGEGVHLRFRYDPRDGKVRACVVEGGRLPERVRAALAGREGGEEDEEDGG